MGKFAFVAPNQVSQQAWARFCLHNTQYLTYSFVSPLLPCRHRRNRKALPVRAVSRRQGCPAKQGCGGGPMPAAHETPPRGISSRATIASVARCVADARHRLAVPARPSDAVCGSCNLVGSASHPNPAFYAPTGRSHLWPSLSPSRACWLTINAAQPPLIGSSRV